MRNTIRKSLQYILLVALTSELAINPVLSLCGLGSTKKMRESLLLLTTEGATADIGDQIINLQRERLGGHALHPFVGFVYDPSLGSGINELGFLGPTPPLDSTTAKTDKPLIGIFGGSVAEDFYQNGGIETLRAESNRCPQAQVLATADFFNFASGGSKQPQHLSMNSYLYALGLRLDVALLIDGFNEVALPITNQQIHNIHYSYPRFWEYKSGSAYSEELILLMSDLIRRDSLRRRIAKGMKDLMLNTSDLCTSVWYLSDLWMQRGAESNKAKIGAITDISHRTYQTHGPAVPDYQDSEKYYHKLVMLWANASEAMRILVESNGGKFYHFLQPNQHLPNSKTFTQEETDNALIIGGFGWKDAVIRGYPLLLKQGLELISKGQRFVDLTQIFQERQETIYVDRCCHINRKGNEIMAKMIVQAICNEGKN